MDALTQNHLVLQILTVGCKKRRPELIADRGQKRLRGVLGLADHLESFLRRRSNDLSIDLLDCGRCIAGKKTFRSHLASGVTDFPHSLREKCKKGAKNKPSRLNPLEIDIRVLLENGAEEVLGFCGVDRTGLYIERCGVVVAAEKIHQNSELLREVDERRAAQADDLGVASCCEEAIEEVATLVVGLVRATGIICLLTQGRDPAAGGDRFKRDRASLASRERCQIRFNGALHETGQIMNLVDDDDGVVERALRPQARGCRALRPRLARQLLQLRRRDAVVVDEGDTRIDLSQELFLNGGLVRRIEFSQIGRLVKVGKPEGGCLVHIVLGKSENL